MEPSTYIIETNFNGRKLAVTGNYDGTTFTATKIEPLEEDGSVVLISIPDIEEHIIKTKFKVK